MNKQEIAEALDTIGTLLELKGENPFRTRAYHNAAQAIRNLQEDVEIYIRQGSLTSIKGIGKDLAERITELSQTGTAKILDDLKASFPSGVVEMLRIPGLGPKKVKILFEQLHITSIPQLKEACERQQLRNLDGFGKKTEENILAGIEQIMRSAGKFLYATAKASADSILEYIKKIKGIFECEIAGSLRRRKEVVGDIDILVSATPSAANAIFDAVVSHPEVERVLSRGTTKASVILKNSLQCDVRIVEKKEFPFALQYFTGSKEHNVELRTRAKKYGWSLNEYGFSYIEGTKPTRQIPNCKSESDIYKALGLHFIPPELREGLGEISAAETALPNLVREDEIKGVLHCHTTYSDGALTPEELISAAKVKRWSFIGIADHSKAAAYAGGMSIEQAQKQLEHLRKLAKQSGDITVFIGIECDILPDGTLDYPDWLLKEYDYVIASVHSKFKMTEAEATQRIVRALEHPFCTMLGHPTGRLLLERDGYPLDLRTVIDTAAKLGKLIEINAHPLRLDLDWRWVRYAKEKGVLLCINPDAHNAAGLNDVSYGVGVARKGWLESHDLLNTWNPTDIQKLFRQLKKGSV